MPDYSKGMTMLEPTIHYEEGVFIFKHFNDKLTVLEKIGKTIPTH